MAQGSVLDIKGFSEAKSALSDVMDEVVHRHRPVLIDRNRGKDIAVIADTSDLIGVLSQLGVGFEPKISVSSEGEFIARLPELNLIAGGVRYEAAMEELSELIEDYAEDFFNRWEFYRHTDRSAHAPWLLLFALTPVAERAALLSTPPPDGALVSPRA